MRVNSYDSDRVNGQWLTDPLPNFVTTPIHSSKVRIGSLLNEIGLGLYGPKPISLSGSDCETLGTSVRQSSNVAWPDNMLSQKERIR